MASSPVKTMPELSSAIDRSIEHFRRIQQPRGNWEADVVWSPILLAQYLLVRHIIGQPVEEEFRTKCLRYFDAWQTAEGGWGLHHESPAYLFVTTLVYIALRTLNMPADDPRLLKARSLIGKLGSPLAIPTWGKIWLAFLNLYDYEGIHAIPPELWLLPASLPMHPQRYYCHTRLIYLGMSQLYGLRFTAPVSDLTLALRRELYALPYDSIDFRHYRNAIAQRDLHAAPSMILRMSYRLLDIHERYHSAALRRRALAYTQKAIEFEQQSTNCAAVSPVNGLLNVLCLYATHPGDPTINQWLLGMDYWQWNDAAEGVRYNGARSQTWDTSFAVQAISVAAPRANLAILQNAAGYLASSQLLTDLDEATRYYRDSRRGGWCFSDEHHGWPVSDTTAEAICAIRDLQQQGITTITAERIDWAVEFILSRQNRDGGWGSYERQRGSLLLESINPSEMFGDCMVEHSYIECSASALDALENYRRKNPAAKHSVAAEKASARGQKFILRSQKSDGSWAGFWGINYTYGTWFAIRGLRASGLPKDHPSIRRACDWLIAHQKADGGWGEHWTSCRDGRYLEHPQSQVIMTAWALLGLLYAQDDRHEAIERGIRLLLTRQLPDGSWPKEGVGGVFFGTAMHHYELYRDYFPLWALGYYAKLTR